MWNYHICFLWKTKLDCSICITMLSMKGCLQHVECRKGKIFRHSECNCVEKKEKPDTFFCHEPTHCIPIKKSSKRCLCNFKVLLDFAVELLIVMFKTILSFLDCHFVLTIAKLLPCWQRFISSKIILITKDANNDEFRI